jgi:hypothetical protein
LIQSFASRRGVFVVVVGRSPRPRAGGLHQSLLDDGPWPLRLVSITNGFLTRFAIAVP